MSDQRLPHDGIADTYQPPAGISITVTPAFWSSQPVTHRVLRVNDRGFATIQCHMAGYLFGVRVGSAPVKCLSCYDRVEVTRDPTG